MENELPTVEENLQLQSAIEALGTIKSADILYVKAIKGVPLPLHKILRLTYEIFMKLTYNNHEIDNQENQEYLKNLHENYNPVSTEERTLKILGKNCATYYDGYCDSIVNIRMMLSKQMIFLKIMKDITDSSFLKSKITFEYSGQIKSYMEENEPLLTHHRCILNSAFGGNLCLWVETILKFLSVSHSISN